MLPYLLQTIDLGFSGCIQANALIDLKLSAICRISPRKRPSRQATSVCNSSEGVAATDPASASQGRQTTDFHSVVRPLVCKRSAEK